jgi:peptidoglycan/LPS O-acetylase OafA/YrhL
MMIDKQTIAKNPSQYFYLVDFIRGIAAISVLIWHYQHFYYTSPYDTGISDKTIQPFYDKLNFFYNYGYLAVELFWLISGFVFASVYLYREKVSPESFFLNRFARLYPLHFLTLIIVALLQMISYKTTGTFQIYPFNDFYHFLLNLSFTVGWGFQKGHSFNEPIWSVSIEVVIYVFFYLILRYIKLLPIVVTGFLIVLLKGLIILFPSQLFLGCGFFFFVGCLTYIFLSKARKYSYLLIILGIVGIIVTVVFPVFKPFSLYQRSTFYASLILIASSIDLLGIKKFGEKVKPLGDLSFSIYLWHVPIQILILLLANYFGVSKSFFSQNVVFLLFCSIVFIVSYFSFIYYEHPLRNYFKNRPELAKQTVK